MRSAGMSKRDVMTYDSVTLELFTEDVADSVKAEYLARYLRTAVMKSCVSGWGFWRLISEPRVP